MGVRVGSVNGVWVGRAFAAGAQAARPLARRRESLANKRRMTVGCQRTKIGFE
jgi:hypothetical protein